MDIVTGEVVDGKVEGAGGIVADAMEKAAQIDAKALGLQDGAQAESKPKKARKPRTASRFMIIPANMIKLDEAAPNIVAARKRIEASGLSGTFYIACLREEVSVETTVPQPVTKVTVKRVAR